MSDGPILEAHHALKNEIDTNKAVAEGTYTVVEQLGNGGFSTSLPVHSRWHTYRRYRQSLQGARIRRENGGHQKIPCY
jgi:hypothetical protein